MAGAGRKLVTCELCGEKRRWPGSRVKQLASDVQFRMWQPTNKWIGNTVKGRYVSRWIKAGAFVCQEHDALSTKATV